MGLLSVAGFASTAELVIEFKLSLVLPTRLRYGLPMTDSLAQQEPAQPQATVAKPSTSSRLDSIDALRGVVMILMAIDHVRDFVGHQVPFRGIDVVKTGAPLFLTRWITHFCAPVFVLLAGTGAYLQAARGKSPAELSRFLLTRGLWLVFLELTFIRLGWTFDLSYAFTGLGVIWALGWCMIFLAGIVRLPVRIVAGLGLSMILLHNLLDGISADSLGKFGTLWAIFHESKRLQPAPGHMAFIVYPLVPWIGVMAAGYALGAFIDVAPELRKRRFLLLGTACSLGFVVLRVVNVYGDPAPRISYDSALYTVLSTLNCTKYPPSLAYLLMTLGPALLLLGLMDGRDYLGKRVFLVFGRAPLFYYILHLYLIHLASLILFIGYYGLEKFTASRTSFGMAEEMLFGLPVVYAMTAVVVLLLYPLCRWFAALKGRRRDLWWLSYL